MAFPTNSRHAHQRSGLAHRAAYDSYDSYAPQPMTQEQASLIEQPEPDRDSITDWCLDQFRARYGPWVTKGDIWEYLYGVMHAPDWRSA